MDIISGFLLDNHHLITEIKDNCGTKSWWLFTFENEIVQCQYPGCDPRNTPCVVCVGRDMYGNGDENPCLWRMEQIDPDNFEWNGQRVKIRKEFALCNVGEEPVNDQI